MSRPHTSAELAGRRLFRKLKEDFGWTEHAGAAGAFFKYEDCVVPAWLAVALDQGAFNKDVQKRLLSHSKRFSFVYAALDYGITPGLLADWVEDGKWSNNQKNDFMGLIAKYRGNEVKLDRFKEQRDCGPFRDLDRELKALTFGTKRRWEEPQIWEGEDFSPEELQELFELERYERAKRDLLPAPLPPYLMAEMEDIRRSMEMKRRRDAKEIVGEPTSKKRKCDRCL
jgi:hypothetical protein